MKLLLFCESFLFYFRGSEAVFGLGSFDESSLYEMLALLIYYTLLSIDISRIVN